ncbi:MAG: c-type cytochrome domain-containing protein, partial [Schlesneria sp.]
MIRLLNAVGRKPRVQRRLGLFQLLFLSILNLVVPAAATELSADDGASLFERNIRPLLIEHCQKCHGPIKQEAGLRLDSREALMTGGEHGPAIVPGKSDQSRLVNAVRHLGDLQMPPKGKLKDKQIPDLEQW